MAQFPAGPAYDLAESTIDDLSASLQAPVPGAQVPQKESGMASRRISRASEICDGSIAMNARNWAMRMATSPQGQSRQPLPHDAILAAPEAGRYCPLGQRPTNWQRGEPTSPPRSSRLT